MAVFRLGQPVEGWVRWSNPVCATLALRQPGPISSTRTSGTFETLANQLTVDSLCRDVPANPHPRLKPVEKVIEIDDPRFSALLGGCGFRCSSWW
jgi:hypothetical protein